MSWPQRPTTCAIGRAKTVVRRSAFGVRRSAFVVRRTPNLEWTTMTLSELDVALFDRFTRPRAEQLEQLGNDDRLVLRIAAGPGPGLDLEEIGAGVRAGHVIDVHVELDAAERDQPAVAIFLDFALARRLEVLAVEAGGVGRGREETRAEEQHRPERRFARRPGERQPRAGADHLALLVEKLVLAVAQAALGGVVEEEVGVVLVIVHGTNHRDVLAGEGLPHRLGRADTRLRLDLEALLFRGPANGDELLQDALLAIDQERVDAPRHVARRRADLVLVDGEEAPVAHQPAAVAHDIDHVGRLRGVDQL